MRKLTMADLCRPSAAEAAQSPKLPYVVVLDNIRSMHNVGSLFRTADAFGCLKLLLCGITGTPPHREIQKTALGSEETVSWVHYADTVTAVQDLKQAGYYCLALEQAEGSIMLQDLVLPLGQPVALVLGNEVEGVQQQVVDACDACLEIPQLGHKHSLNVSVAAGVAMWEIAKVLMNAR